MSMWNFWRFMFRRMFITYDWEPPRPVFPRIIRMFMGEGGGFI